MSIALQWFFKTAGLLAQFQMPIPILLQHWVSMKLEPGPVKSQSFIKKLVLHQFPVLDDLAKLEIDV